MNIVDKGLGGIGFGLGYILTGAVLLGIFCAAATVVFFVINFAVSFTDVNFVIEYNFTSYAVALFIYWIYNKFVYVAPDPEEGAE